MGPGALRFTNCTASGPLAAWSTSSTGAAQPAATPPRDYPALVEEYESLPDYFTTEQQAVGRLLDRDPRPDAVVGVYSDSGHNILAAARQHDLRVPRDLLVACISEDPDYATTTPPVTTVSLRPDVVGAEAVDLLIALINARGDVDRRRLVPPVLIPRRSTVRPKPRRAIRAATAPALGN